MPQYNSDVREDSGEGGFLSNIPMWVWIAGAGIIILILFVLGRGSTSSGASNPVTSAVPDTGNTTPLGNFSAALDKVQSNQTTLADAIKNLQLIPGPAGPAGPAGPTAAGVTLPVVNPPPASGAPAAPPATAGPANRFYTVVSGDTLWGIATRYYGSGNQYPKIFEANRGPGQISDPNLIFPGQRLLIPA